MSSAVGSAQPLAFFPPVALHLVGEVGHHVEKDVIVEDGGKTGFRAALDGDQAVLQLIADNGRIGALAEREGSNVHQVDVVLDRRVINRGDKKGQLSVFARGRGAKFAWARSPASAHR